MLLLLLHYFWLHNEVRGRAQYDCRNRYLECLEEDEIRRRVEKIASCWRSHMYCFGMCLNEQTVAGVRGGTYSVRKCEITKRIFRQI